MSESKTPNPFTEPAGSSRELVKQLLEHVKPVTDPTTHDLSSEHGRLELARAAGRREIVKELARALNLE